MIPIDTSAEAVKQCAIRMELEHRFETARLLRALLAERENARNAAPKQERGVTSETIRDKS